MKKLTIFIFSILLTLHCNEIYSQLNLHYDQNQTLTYDECIQAYQYLDSISDMTNLIEYGQTDCGKPLHLFIISKSKEFNPEKLHEQGKRIILVNNGIHPGESCGVDASVQLAFDIVENKDQLQLFLDNVVICFIPIYNIGGALNRSCCSRANQNGPEEKGFRGNAKYLDLNRDFIKCDSKNAKSFTEIFHTWEPDIFIDTHTSNGADYQYVMTLLATLHSKMQADLGHFLKNDMTPWLFDRMNKFGYEMTPYVEWNNRTPENGLIASFDPPRFSSGYAALFNCISFTTETHMFKPFKDRVLSTYYFLRSTLEFTHNNAWQIAAVRKKAFDFDKNAKRFPVKWQLDSTRTDTVVFKGYEAEFYTSKITGDKRTYYNRNKPWAKKVPYYANYNSIIEATSPKYYIIPQAWSEVIERLKLNKIEMTELLKDTMLQVEAFRIESYETSKNGYFWHYPHNNVKVNPEKIKVQFYKGDIVIKVDQKYNRFLVTMLDPRCDDSYFSWNFFESILHQKEWFSPYIFEDYALDMLNNNPELKSELEQLKNMDSTFAANSWRQLYFIYQHSEFFEKGLNLYPVYRVMD